MIKMIAFDLFGVVFTEGHMITATLMPLLPEGTDKKQLKNLYNQYTVGKIIESAFWQGINQPNNNYNKPRLRDDFLDSFVLDDDLSQVIDTLSERYSLSILSNLATDWADTLIDKFNFKQSFEPIIISGKEGVGKPDKRIYEILIKRSELAPQEIIFIDDRLENLATAHALGMQTIHYQHESDDYNFLANYQISQLKDIIGFL